MKSVIVEIRGKYAAALSDDGRVTKVLNRGYAVGQTVDLAAQTGVSARKIAVWAASAAAVLVLCGASGFAYYTPYSYVSIDINPSVEYTLNRFDRVLSVEATDPESETVLQNIDPANLSNKSIGTAVSMTVRKLEELGYLESEASRGIVIAASAADRKKAEKLARSLEQTVEEETSGNAKDVVVEAFDVGEERVAEARELGVTPGRLRLIEKLQESAADPESVDLEEWLEKPIRDIMEATKENKKASGGDKGKGDDNDKPTSNGKGNDGNGPKAAEHPSPGKGEGTAAPTGNRPEDAKETPKSQESSNHGRKPDKKSDSDKKNNNADRGGKTDGGEEKDKASKGKNGFGDKIGKSRSGGGRNGGGNGHSGKSDGDCGRKR